MNASTTTSSSRTDSRRLRLRSPSRLAAVLGMAVLVGTFGGASCSSSSGSSSSGSSAGSTVSTAQAAEAVAALVEVSHQVATEAAAKKGNVVRGRKGGSAAVTVTCSGGGSVAVTLAAAGSAADVSLDFSECVDGTTTLNGTVTAKITVAETAAGLTLTAVLTGTVSVIADGITSNLVLENVTVTVVEHGGATTVTTSGSFTDNGHSITLTGQTVTFTLDGGPDGGLGDHVDAGPELPDTGADAGPGPGVVTLLSKQKDPFVIAANATDIYWGDKGTGAIVTMPVGGGTPKTIASKQVAPTGITLDASYVYWTTLGNLTVMRAPLAGGTPETLASDQDCPGGIAVDSGYVYWSNTGENNCDNVDSVGTSGIFRKALEGGVIATIATEQSFPNGVAVSGQYVYWAATDDATVVRAPIGGGTATTLAENLNGVTSIAADAQRVYWLGVEGIFSEPLAGGKITTLSTSSVTPSVMTIDATHVYWTDYDGGFVYKVPLAGGTQSTLAREQHGAVGIAANATSVFWVDDPGYTNGGSINKVTPK